jgi:hypothetical protein
MHPRLDSSASSERLCAHGSWCRGALRSGGPETHARGGRSRHSPHSCRTPARDRNAICCPRARATNQNQTGRLDGSHQNCRGRYCTACDRVFDRRLARVGAERRNARFRSAGFGRGSRPGLRDLPRPERPGHPGWLFPPYRRQAGRLPVQPAGRVPQRDAQIPADELSRGLSPRELPAGDGGALRAAPATLRIARSHAGGAGRHRARQCW